MSSKNSTARTFIFAIVMCVVCSFLLTAASVGLKSRQVKNVEIDKQKNILKSLNLLEGNKKYQASEIESLYLSKVNDYFLNENGELLNTKKSETDLPIFIVGNQESVSSYAIPFKAYGLWSWVYGYIALDGDGNTILGLTVYQHGETPGLGGEVEKQWFQDQFVGKKITALNGDFVSISIVKGKVEDSIPEDKRLNYVDGISGATITSVGMQKYIKIDLAKYEPFSKRLRGAQ